MSEKNKSQLPLDFESGISKKDQNFQMPSFSPTPKTVAKVLTFPKVNGDGELSAKAAYDRKLFQSLIDSVRLFK
jgi:hypothetical protein